MIKPEGIPTDRNLSMYVQLKSTAVQLKQGGHAFQTSGDEFHGRFQGLGPPVYVAPEGEDLRNSTEPVKRHSADFGWRLQRVSETLWHFADSAWKRETELRAVKAAAEHFVKGVEGTGDEWKRSADKVAENNALIGRVESALAGRLADEVHAHNQIQGLINGPILPPDGGLGGDAGKEPPWGTREKSPSVLDNILWTGSLGRMAEPFALPDWAKLSAYHFDRFMNPILGALAGLAIGGPNLIYHHAADPAGQFQKDLEALKGIAQIVTGLATNNGLSALGFWGPSRGLQESPFTPTWLKTWLKESDKGAASFAGFDKFAKWDISGGAGTFVANVGALIFTRKLPPGLGASAALSKLGSTRSFAALGEASRIGRGIQTALKLGSDGRLGRSLDAIIDAAPLRFIKSETRAFDDATVARERDVDDDARAESRAAELDARAAARAAQDSGFEQKRQQVEIDSARGDREADARRRVEQQNIDNALAEQRRAADAERPPTPDEIAARREADINEAVKRQDDVNAVAEARTKRDNSIIERQRQHDEKLADERRAEDAGTAARFDDEDAATERERKREDVEVAVRRKDFDTGQEFGQDSVRSTAIALRELRKLLSQGIDLADTANAQDPFAEGRPLDELADRLQRELGIERDEAEKLARRAVRLRKSGITEDDLDSLRGRVDGGRMDDLQRGLGELELQQS